MIVDAETVKEVDGRILGKLIATRAYLSESKLWTDKAWAFLCR